MADGLLLFGAGGHGRVVADAAMGLGHWRALYATYRGCEASALELLPGVALLGLSEALALGYPVHVAIGDNMARERESAALGETLGLTSVRHPRACVSAFAELGQGCFVAAQAVVGPHVRLGRGVIVNHGAVVDHDAVVGAFSHVAPGATMGGGACLGSRVLVGANATVLPGVRVADDVVIGAGAVVCCDLLMPGTYVGVPARRLR
jgi:sugar O-acyltransferase (sialic acid O-acetyltransferase NeuD family)